MEHKVIDIDNKKLQQMMFIFSSLDDGWNIKKRNKSYIFIKKHEGKKEVFTEEFLTSFIKKNNEFKINLI
jgi:hypothetical protein